MPSAFTRFASSRFLDAQAVREQLRRAAQRLRAERPEVTRVLLFGSLAAGVPTPHSDADLLVEVGGRLPPRARRERAVLYAEAFGDVELPVDVFVATGDEIAAALQDGRGVVATAVRTGLRLA